MSAFPKDAYRPQERDEVRGPLLHLEEVDSGCLALIGKIRVLLPPEVAGELQSLVGRRVGVLRLEGYRVRDLDSEAHA